MRVATIDGLVTLFYDGSRELYNEELTREWLHAYYNEHNENINDWEDWALSNQCKEYWKERQTWQQIIIEDGVKTIPKDTFYRCKNIKRVQFSNTVIQIEYKAFCGCEKLFNVNFPINLEYIGSDAFRNCNLVNIFIPPRCRKIDDFAFIQNENLAIFNVSPAIELGNCVFRGSKLWNEANFKGSHYSDVQQEARINAWLKNINSNEKYALHRACCSYQPLKEVIYGIMKEKGINAFQLKNEIGVTPSQYLKENPYADVTEMEIVQYYVMKMMGEL